MYARVVRFTDVDPERIARIAGEIEKGEGPPPEIPSTKLTMMVDEAQSTAVVAVFFETQEDMRKGNEALDAMDAGDTPGSRVSVDLCEVKFEMEVN
jgi:hypothetical protein